MNRIHAIGREKYEMKMCNRCLCLCVCVCVGHQSERKKKKKQEKKCIFPYGFFNFVLVGLWTALSIHQYT